MAETTEHVENQVHSGPERERLRQEAKMRNLPAWLAERIHTFKRIERPAENVFWDRGRKYGDATRDTGLVGAVVTLTGDASRLKRLVLDFENLQALLGDGWRDDESVYTDIVDTLIDIHNYSAIAYYWLTERNILGE